MKLSLIIENVDKMVQVISQRDKIEPTKIKEIITTYSPNLKYNQYVLRQWYTHNIRLPEDGNRVKETLNNFNVVKGKLQNKDLLSYKSLNDLENAIEPYIGTTSKRQGGSDIVDPTKLEGVELIKQVGNYKSYKIYNSESLQQLGEGTKWCTRGSYEDCMADDYLNDNDWIGQIWEGNKPIIQYTSDYEQVMDRNDEEVIPAKLGKNLKSSFIRPSKQDSWFVIDNFANNIIGGRWLKAEPTILKNSKDAYNYAKDVIKGRWPEAEPIIGKQSLLAVYYAKDVIKGRWPEAEPTILKDPYVAYEYARNVMRSRWPEAEPTIAEHTFIAYEYAAYVIKGRWPEAEPIIAKDPLYAYNYAKDVIKGRWPEAEPTILKDKNLAHYYTKYVAKEHRPKHNQ